jgi:hypothetical protein
VSAIEILHYQWRIRLLGIVQRYFFAPVENYFDSGDADHHSGGGPKTDRLPARNRDRDHPGMLIGISPES